MKPETAHLPILTAYGAALGLEGTAANEFSQFGEDGLIDAAIRALGMTGWACSCFEIGASDGITGSNIRRLVMRREWPAAFIEAEPDLFTRLVDNVGDLPGAWPVLARVWPGELDQVLTAALPHGMSTLGLGVIDIDGADYYLWAGLRARPSLMLVEYAFEGDPNALPPMPRRDMVPGCKPQAGYNRLIALGAAKGYVLLARTPCNLLFALAPMVKNVTGNLDKDAIP